MYGFTLSGISFSPCGFIGFGLLMFLYTGDWCGIKRFRVLTRKFKCSFYLKWVDDSMLEDQKKLDAFEWHNIFGPRLDRLAHFCCPEWRVPSSCSSGTSAFSKTVFINWLHMPSLSCTFSAHQAAIEMPNPFPALATRCTDPSHLRTPYCSYKQVPARLLWPKLWLRDKGR